VPICTDDLVTTVTHVPNELRGVWAHRLIAIRLAQKCNADFAVLITDGRRSR
jgi:hypothetical protein